MMWLLRGRRGFDGLGDVDWMDSDLIPFLLEFYCLRVVLNAIVDLRLLF